MHAIVWPRAPGTQQLYPVAVPWRHRHRAQALVRRVNHAITAVKQRAGLTPATAASAQLWLLLLQGKAVVDVGVGGVGGAVGVSEVLTVASPAVVATDLPGAVAVGAGEVLAV